MEIRKFVIFGLLFGLLLQSPMVGAEEANIVFPFQINEVGSFSSNSYNDIYIQPNSYLSTISSDFWTERGSFRSIYYDENQRNQQGITSAFQQFTPNLNQGILQARNESSDLLSINYSFTYYDILRNFNDGNSILTPGNNYGFKFEGTAGDPLILSLGIEGESSLQSMIRLTLISPSEKIERSTEVFYRYNQKQIPIVPYESGIYTVFFEPLNENLYFSKFELSLVEDVQTFDRQIAEHLEGTDPEAKLFQYTVSDESVSEFSFDIETQEYIVDSSQYGTLPNTYYFGELTVLAFFGNSLGIKFEDLLNNLPTFSTEKGSLGSSYFAIVITPPNDEDADVKALKGDLELQEGYLLDYSISSQTHEIPTIPKNTNFFTGGLSYNNLNNYYKLEVGSNEILTINSTSPVTMEMTNVNTKETISLSSLNDIYNFNDADFTIISSGSYIVQLPRDINVQINSIDKTIMSTDELTMDLEINNPQMIFLTNLDNLWELYNFTYLTQENMTVLIEIDYFDVNGNWIGSGVGDSTSVTTCNKQGKNCNTNVIDIPYAMFSHVSSSTNTSYSVDSTIEYLLPEYNFEGLYMRVQHFNNTLWNSTTQDPFNEPVIEYNVDVDAQLKIKRISNFDRLQGANPSSIYEFTDISNGFTGFLPSLNNTIQYFMNFGFGDGVYHLTITSENRSLTASLFLESNLNVWYNNIGASVQSINQINYYTIELDFVLLHASSPLLFLNFGNPINGLNATFNIQFYRSSPYTLPDLSLTLINFDEENIFVRIFTSPIFYGSLAGAAIIGVIVFLIKKRKSNFDL
ncbi:MAG: hypothetical protein OEZ01_01040 [Candidatus Heimdallarchaeota archaeon]|nr:hypothetical protein [Candidatus Heimdallarchaeota archaeon]